MNDESQDINGAISAEKFRRFLRASKGNKEAARTLYLWNVRCSSHLFAGLHLWEIGMRNRIDAYLRGELCLDWTADFEDSSVFEDYQKMQIYRARQKVKRQRGQRPPHGAIVAELTAGFWVSLLSKKYSVTLKINKNLNNIFPFYKSKDRASLHEKFTGHLKIRNRIAHHEHMLDYDIIGEWASIGQSIRWTCPILHMMYQRLPSIEELSKEDPRKA